jgi:DNA-binding response OmpR family regulator
MNARRRILIVDDNRDVTAGLQSALGQFVDVDVAHSGSEAIQSCEERHYDAVILDVELGCGISGLETAAIIRRTQADVRIVIISALDYSTDVRQRSLELGAVFYQKTVTTEDILKAIASEPI